jgi:hypothetical protein
MRQMIRSPGSLRREVEVPFEFQNEHRTEADDKREGERLVEKRNSSLGAGYIVWS